MFIFLLPKIFILFQVAAMPAEQVKYMTDKIPMKRTGTIEEVAGLAAYVASEECSFTTGFAFDASGGRAVY
jgi:NAD(P)-dependent dehydrogenase (short-subunit alcohol dehydrogenase family)